MTRRRDLLGLAVAASGAGLASAAGAQAGPELEGFSSLYDVDRTIANFDAAYYGVMTRPVHADYLARLAWMNRHNSSFLRDAVPGHHREAELNAVQAQVGELIGAAEGEIGLCGGGTEALYALIVNYRLLTPGDQVIFADVDYDEMQHAMAYLQQSRGAQIVRFSLPEPSTRANILAAYDKVLKDSPRAKLLLLTHLSNRHGLIPPVKEIVDMARARGVDVILDSAQAVGQLPFKADETGADFIGFSLHKWVAAPLGTGGVYIRKSRLADISPWLGNHIYEEDDVRARIPTGTVDFSARLTVPTAIEVHNSLGPERKLKHLLALRDYWVERVRDIKGLEVLLPDEPGNHGATTSFRMPGMKGLAAAKSVQQLFLNKHKVLVVAKAGLASGPILRVTPALFNTRTELDRLVEAIRTERGMFG
jgi:selenocysteine lyase/cysteine desulfurase